MSDEAIIALYAPDSYELVPHDKIRRIIARRMSDAKRTIPHFYLTADLDLDALLELRHEINAASSTGADGRPIFHVSLTDMIVMAMAMALEDVPDANVTWTEGGMLRHRHADIGVAVAIPGGGLITPIIRAADTKKLSEVSHEMKDLVARGRERKLLPEEYQGGVTSISNLGMYAIREFAAVINPPQSSILAVGTAEPRPVVRKGALTSATVMTVTLATDHRAVDGVVGAELLKAFRHHIEKPAGMLV
jgi:pyruvate dehydrogenase E2 component (dihydrolipoamide acetyltransferase)